MINYSELCSLFEKIESIQSRNEMSDELAAFLKKCNSEEVEIISYMIQGRVAPMFVKSEFNYSEKSLINLLKQYTSEDIAAKRRSSGDIGDTIFEIWKEYTEKGKSLKVKEIYEVLWEIVNTSGNGSVSRKNKTILNCLKKLNPLESKYFVRTVCGDLRLGLSVRSLLDVFSISKVGDKSLKEELERAYGVCSDIGYVGKKVFEADYEGIGDSLSMITTIPGNPILSRLVQRVASFDELKERFKEEVLLQPKFDGLRCQIHKWKGEPISQKEYNSIWREYIKDGEEQSQDLFKKDSSSVHVKLFTRNLEDVTEMFPEIVDSAREMNMDSFVMDSEIVGWDYKKNTFLSYQETMQRRRKYSVESMKGDIPVRAFAFDLLYLKGESLIKRNTKKRVEFLEELLHDTQSHTQRGIVLAESKVFSEKEDIKGYFNKCVQEGLEGIIVKQLEGEYCPGDRNYEWVKIKKSIDENLVDTIDMVVVGYFKGSGRRASFGLGAILGAIRNEEEDTFDAICKIGTGMRDKQLEEMNSKLSEIAVERQPKDVRVYDILKPDIWVSSKYVITVDADEITKNISKNDIQIGEGLSLRFPRLVEFGRDKGIEDITTVQELVDMYEMRKQ